MQFLRCHRTLFRLRKRSIVSRGNVELKTPQNLVNYFEPLLKRTPYFYFTSHLNVHLKQLKVYRCVVTCVSWILTKMVGLGVEFLLFVFFKWCCRWLKSPISLNRSYRVSNSAYLPELNITGCPQSWKSPNSKTTTGAILSVPHLHPALSKVFDLFISKFFDTQVVENPFHA